jgi:glycine/D-amino acid oxidase-like deaminating enzyme
MRQTDVLIIGQGICGTFLSWCLEKSGLSFIVIDEPFPFTASKAAAGLINPVTGRRIVKTWMIDELLPFADEAYRRIGQDLGISCIRGSAVIDFFPTPQMRVAFLERHAEDSQYLELPADENDWRKYFQYDFGYGAIGPCRLVDLSGLLDVSRKWMLQRGSLLEERFEGEAMVLDDSAGSESNSAVQLNSSRVRYKDISAGRIIFCDGIESASSPYFSKLPFAPNKGEALIVDISDLPMPGNDPSAASIATVFKKGISLAPWKDGLYWVGSSYEWSFDHGDPTEAFRKRTESILRDWLKVPFTTVEHLASVRPATLERRPFVGFHPLHPAVGILNGMGTKGCSLAPYFAYQMVEYLTKGMPIRPDADVQRFSKVLSRG